MEPVTNIEYEGDQYRARQLAAAHVNRLLFDFRRNNSFQKLAINAALKNFYDENGRYIGSIKMHTDNGLETVVVDVPPVEFKAQPLELWLDKPERGDRIVPIIQSTDNDWWVACMGGAFNGPYYAFKNIYDLPLTQMDGNADGVLNDELHNRLVSIGGAALNGVMSPKLFFIAQTGTLPDSGEIDEDTSEYPPASEWKTWEDMTVAEKKVVTTSNDAVCCPSAGYAAMETVVDYKYDLSYAGYTTVYGERMEYLPSTYRDRLNLTGTFQLPKLLLGGLSCDDAKALINSKWASEDDSFFENEYLAGSGYYSKSTTVAQWFELNAISMESSSLFAAVYRTTDRDAETTVQREYEQCEENDQEVLVSKDDRIYKDYLQVNETVYLLREHPLLQIYPTYSTGPGFLKYYHTDSPAQTTCLFGAYLFVTQASGLDKEYAYHYVGPNSDNSLNVVTFPRLEGTIGHSIPNVIGLPDDDGIKFAGEVFLGRVRTSSEEKVKVY